MCGDDGGVGWVVMTRGGVGWVGGDDNGWGGW